MATKFFRKALVSNPVYIKGAPVPFDLLSGNSGVIALDEAEHAVLVEGLSALSVAKKAGVVEITEAEYEDIKKKRRLGSFAPRSGQAPPRLIQPASPFKIPSPLEARRDPENQADAARAAEADRLRVHLANKARSRTGVGPTVAAQPAATPARPAAPGNKVQAAVAEAPKFTPKLSPAPVITRE